MTDRNGKEVLAGCLVRCRVDVPGPNGEKTAVGRILANHRVKWADVLTTTPIGMFTTSDIEIIDESVYAEELANLEIKTARNRA